MNEQENTIENQKLDNLNIKKDVLLLNLEMIKDEVEEFIKHKRDVYNETYHDLMECMKEIKKIELKELDKKEKNNI